MMKKLAETLFTPEPPRQAGRSGGKFTFPPESRPLDGYTIKRGIHRGGFGEVYYALSDAGKEVALKLLQQHMDVELRGVSQCLNLKHPNLVNIYDIRTDADGDHWIVMEYVAGQGLDSVLDNYASGMPIEEITKWLEGMSAGLSFLHDRGIVHRDLKPANVFSEHGVVKIGDVGLSKFISESHRSAHTQSVGTVYYMAPEVAHGRYGREVDIYSLGVVLYELLTGRVPFEGESAGEILMKHLSEKPDLQPIPSRLRPVLARALEKDPLKRTPTVNELLDEFRRAAAGESIPEYSASGAFPGAANRNGDPAQVAAIFDAASIKAAAAHEAKKAFGHAQRAARDALRVAHDEVRKAAREANYKPWRAAQQAGYKGGPPPLPVRPTIDPSAPLDDSTHWWHRTPWWVKLIGAIAIAATVADNLGDDGLKLVVLAAAGYGVYHLVGWISGSPSRNQQVVSGAVPYMRAAAVAVPAPPRQAPMTPEVAAAKYAEYAKKKVRKRAYRGAYLLTPDTLRQISVRSRAAELTGAMTFAAVCSLLMTIGLMFTDFFSTEASAGLFGLTTFLGACGVLVVTKLSEGTSIDSLARRVGMVAMGLVVGAAAFWMQSTLMVGQFDHPDALVNSLGSQPLTSRNDLLGFQPSLLGYMIFFAALLGVRKWWWQGDAFRRRRFGVGTVLSTMLIGFLITCVWAFPHDWGVIWAGAISSVVHLSAPWVSPGERSRFAEAVGQA